MKYIPIAIALVAITSFSSATKITSKNQDSILYSSGHYLEDQPITTGFDIFGYNYQARLFSGSYSNAYLGGSGFAPYEGDDAAYLAIYPSAEDNWTWPYRNDSLTMKWNDAWLSNQDRDEDGSLDRHYGFDSYLGSGAWLTNHQSGSYLDSDGKLIHWTYFVKILAAPMDATLVDNVWFTADGIEIGPAIWGEFAIVLEISNDPGTGDHGPIYVSPAGPGLGKY